MKIVLLPLCLAILILPACKRPESAQPASATPPVAVQPKVQAPTVPAKPVDEMTAPKPVLPTLQVTTIEGAPYNLSGHRGKWVVVNFWATWCAPCLKEMPELSALDAMREHVEVVGLAYEDIEPAEMKTFLQKHPVVYPVAILDVYAPPKDFATPRGLPMTYLIAPDGKVAKQFLGPVTAKEVEGAITAAGGPAASA